MNMPIAVGDITPCHLGRTVTITETGGNVITGRLKSVHAFLSVIAKNDAFVNVELTTDQGEYTLSRAEVNYLIQLHDLPEQTSNLEEEFLNPTSRDEDQK